MNDTMQQTGAFKGVIWVVALSLGAFLLTKTVNEIRYPIDLPIQPSITVSGEGEVFAVPDIATVSFSVTEESAAVATAQSSAKKKIDAIIAALAEKGIAEKDYKTTGYNVYPRYEYEQSSGYSTGRRSLAAYVVSQNMTVKVRDLEKAGEIVGALGKLGATDVSGLSFEIDDDAAVQAEARSEAIADAEAKAAVMAKALGVRLVRVIGFSEDGYYPPVAYRTMAAEGLGMGGDAAGPSLPAGENQITSRVNITYEIR